MPERERQMALGADGVPSHLLDKRLSDHFGVPVPNVGELDEIAVREAYLCWEAERDVAEQTKKRNETRY